MINIEIAGLPVALDNKYSFVSGLAREYITEKDPLFTVSATDDDIEAERRASEQEYPNGYLESVVLYRKIADRLPEFEGFVFHGAVVVLDGRAYAFTARSGVGKTTHTRLWLSEFGERAHYLNGDKPVIRFFDGVPYACGTPYKGKEGYGTKEDIPLCGIAFLERSEQNRAREISPDSAAVRLMSQIYLPKNGRSVMTTMSLADRLLHSVRLVELGCNMEPEAAWVAMRALTGAK